MKVKTTIAALFLNLIYLGLFAQIPLVYSLENTGAGCAPPSLPFFNQLPVIEPLTDPFMWSSNMGRSTNFNDWECRRNEIKAEIENYEIGTKPDRPDTITASFTPGTTPGSGTLTVIVTENGQTLTLNSNVSLPTTGNGPFPAVIGMNSLNGSIPADIFTTRNIARITFSHNQVTTYLNPQITNPYYRLYPSQNLSNSGQYSAWAWGVSRIIDGLELVQSSLPIDLKHIGVTGCSYAGKMALFAGAFDERIALTIAQESGGGGAPAWRVSETLGTVEKLGATDYNWFRDSMRQFAGFNVSKLPHDHHELMAMIAPRALLVTGNTDFEWLANPSAYVSARAAHEVWKTFGVGDRFGFYIDGGHGHCAIPASQRPAIEAFVEKFLLGNTSSNTDVTVHPYPLIDYQRWFQWWGSGIPVLPAEPPGKRIWLEAECGIVGSNWNVLTDTAASNGIYVTIRGGLNSTATAPPNVAANHVVLPFMVDSAATYNFLARVNCPSADDDSYWIRVDSGSFINANGLATTGWGWVRLTNANLSVGPHTLTIAYREDGALLDKVLITTSNASFTGKGDPAINCGGGGACPRDTTILVASCSGTTPVTWKVPVDTFPATIQIPAGLTPDILTPTGQGRLNFLGSFGGHGYYRSTDAYQWPLANTTAMSVGGGHLATLSSAAENMFITNSVQSYGYFSWIGLSRNNIQSNFAWVTGEPLSYTNWGPMDPNNLGGDAQNLVEPYVHIYEGSGRWHDLREAPLPFLAEFDTALIRWRQISGPANGSNLAAGTYQVCYERSNTITNEKSVCCFTVTVQCGTPITRAVIDNGILEVGASSLRVAVNPNPAPNDFTIRIQSSGSERIQMVVTDILGRIVETRMAVLPNSTLHLGQKYRSGVYMLKLFQGKQMKTMKLIKK